MKILVRSSYANIEKGKQIKEIEKIKENIGNQGNSKKSKKIEEIEEKRALSQADQGVHVERRPRLHGPVAEQQDERRRSARSTSKVGAGNPQEFIGIPRNS